MFGGDNRRPSVALLTSSVCLAAWYRLGSYPFWAAYLPDDAYTADTTVFSPGVASLAASVLLLGIVPLLVVKFVLRERLSDYGVRLGNIRFALICCLLATPLLVLIGYSSSRSPAFQAVYPTDPAALKSATNLAIHLVEQIAFYAAWEFHFRGFLQHAAGETKRHRHRHLGTNPGQHSGPLRQTGARSVRRPDRWAVVGSSGVEDSLIVGRHFSTLVVGRGT